MSDKSKVTHCAGCEWVGKDGVKRSVSIQRYSDAGIQINIRTWWDGEDKEPMTTHLGLGAESFDKVTDGVLAFRMRLSDFEIKDDDTSEDKR